LFGKTAKAVFTFKWHAPIFCELRVSPSVNASSTVASRQPDTPSHATPTVWARHSETSAKGAKRFWLLRGASPLGGRLRRPRRRCAPPVRACGAQEGFPHSMSTGPGRDERDLWCVVILSFLSSLPLPLTCTRSPASLRHLPLPLPPLSNRGTRTLWANAPGT
jgi:hypothetical protein